MRALLRLWWDICCFKRNPEDMPYSPTLLVIVSMCHWLLTGYIAWMSNSHWQKVILAASGYMVALLVLPYLILSAARKSARYVQMQTALLGAALVLKVIAFLVVNVGLLLMQVIPMSQYLVLVMVVAIVVWTISVQGRIYQSALEQSRFFAICIVIFVTLMSSSLFEWLLGIKRGVL